MIPGTDGRSFDIVCYNCNRRGHYASSCPEAPSNVGVSNLQYGHSLTQVNQGIIPDDWILLDTCSTDNVVKDKSLLENLCTCEAGNELKIITNGGQLTYDKYGTFKFLPLKAFYNPSSIANVISMVHVCELYGYRMTMNTQHQGTVLWLHHGTNKIGFKHSSNGLFYTTVEALRWFNDNVTYSSATNITQSAPVRFNLLSMQERSISSDLNKLNKVRKVQEFMMWPSLSTLESYIKHGLIPNVPVTEEDVRTAKKVMNTSTTEALGKMTSPPQVANPSSQVPDDESSPTSNVKLYVDVFYVSGIPFLHTKSKPINYITIEQLHNRKVSTIKKS